MQPTDVGDSAVEPGNFRHRSQFSTHRRDQRRIEATFWGTGSGYMVDVANAQLKAAEARGRRILVTEP